MTKSAASWNNGKQFARVMWVHIRMAYPWRECNRLLKRAGISWDEIESGDYALTRKQQALFAEMLSPDQVQQINDNYPPETRPSGWQRILGDKYGQLYAKTNPRKDI